MYALVLQYLVRAADDIVDYDSFVEYLKDGWNDVELLNVIFFLMVVGIRAVWMIRGYQFTFVADLDAVEEDYNADDYIPLRDSMLWYRMGQNFFALGVLLSFFKAFRFISVTNRLAQFSKTIVRCYVDMAVLCFILGVCLAGYAIAFHIVFGQEVKGYMDFPESLLTLFLSLLGDLDLDELRNSSPGLGIVLFLTFIITMMFVVLSLLLKIVDIHYLEVREDMEKGNEAGFVAEFRLACRSIAHDIYWYLQFKKTVIHARVSRLCTNLRSRGRVANGNPQQHLGKMEEGEGLERRHEQGQEAPTAPKTEEPNVFQRLKDVKNKQKQKLKTAGLGRRDIRAAIRNKTLDSFPEKDIEISYVDEVLDMIRVGQSGTATNLTKLAKAVEYIFSKQFGVKLRESLAVTDAELITIRSQIKLRPLDPSIHSDGQESDAPIIPQLQRDRSRIRILDSSKEESNEEPLPKDQIAKPEDEAVVRTMEKDQTDKKAEETIAESTETKADPLDTLQQEIDEMISTFDDDMKEEKEKS